jgi:hypothetical protein
MRQAVEVVVKEVVLAQPLFLTPFPPISRNNQQPQKAHRISLTVTQ